jgi:ribosome-binding protein aMBF1 (putative translation factor)
VDEDQGFLEEMDAERTARNSQFPALLAAARERRAFIRELAAKRRELGLSQAELARRMKTTQPYLSRFESGELDPSHSFEDRFAAALGLAVKREIVTPGRS